SLWEVSSRITALSVYPSDESSIGYIRKDGAGKKAWNFIVSSQPIVQLKFNRTGSLLAVAPVDGCKCLLFSLHPLCSYTLRLISILIRGKTRAHITSLSFNAPSSLLSITSARGTTHIFSVIPSHSRPSDLQIPDPILISKPLKRISSIQINQDTDDSSVVTPAVPSVLFLSSRLYFPHDNYSSIDINSSDSTPNSTTGDKIIGSAKDAGKKN
ncbi:MAG: hypothetical protein EZS28_028265, partial [Streblomastix strix]